MTDGPIEFPVDEDARERLSQRSSGWRGRRRFKINEHVSQPKAFSAETHARIRADERRRAMPETLMLWVIWTVGILTVVPVLLLALVGY